MTNIKKAKEYISEVIKVLDTIEIAKDKADKMRQEMEIFEHFQNYYPVVRSDLSICRAYGLTNNHRELQVVADYAILKIDQLAGCDNQGILL